MCNLLNKKWPISEKSTKSLVQLAKWSKNGYSKTQKNANIWNSVYICT